MKMKVLFKAKVIEPWSKLMSKFKHKFEKRSMSLRAPTFRLPKRRRGRPRLRTKTVRFKKPFSIKSLRFPRCRPKTSSFRLKKSGPTISSKLKFRRRRKSKSPNKPVQKVRIAEILTVLFSLRKAKELERESTDQVMTDVNSVSVVSERGTGKEPFPSPITPAYAKHCGDRKEDSTSDDLDDVEDGKKDGSSDGLEDVEDSCRSFESYLVEMIVEEGKLKDLMDVEELLYCWRNLKSPVFIELVCRFYGELCRDLFSPLEQDGCRETNSSE